ncbi:unnamed protein product [Rodentolepis nana]|uniref:Uncharacterized protein n=1 Tax=Rodentolepis nana TaxID=102285 RepID=A0A0R3TXA3_RODNA|nr:unnamed protein product [Rodentolepis nana]
MGVISHQLPACPRGDEVVKKISALSVISLENSVGANPPTIMSPTLGICAAPVAHLDVGIGGSFLHLNFEIVKKTSVTYYFVSCDLQVEA